MTGRIVEGLLYSYLASVPVMFVLHWLDSMRAGREMKTKMESRNDGVNSNSR